MKTWIAPLLLALPLAALPAAPATAVSFTVTPGFSAGLVRGNDFRRDLRALGLTRITSRDASMTLARTARLQFSYMGSESGFINSFVVGNNRFAETNKANWGAAPMFTSLQLAGPVTNWLFTSNRGVQNRGIGTREFAIFLPASLPDGRYTTNRLLLGFDDQINNRDDDHDDFIVAVSGVPEPASWLMLMAGFGLAGSALRRQRLSVAVR